VQLMKRFLLFFTFILSAALMVSMTVLESDAWARAGGGRSMGSRGSRSYSRPASPSPYQQAAPAPRPASPMPFSQPAPAGGGFFRSMMGGIAGGLLGGMLFRGLGFGGMGGGGYGGPGLFDILLIGGICYLIYRMVKKRRQESTLPQAFDTSYRQADYQQPQASYQFGTQPESPPTDDLATGLSHIRQLDPGFDEGRFKDSAMDIFFRVQGAWMNRDLAPVVPILAADIRRTLQEDVDRLRREQRVNRLENIAMRNVELVEAWQESGQDFITARIYANLLDYTTDEAGNVLEGSKSDPVKFEEFWTYTRPVGNNPWQLAGIQQV
jgi:predicted lipid-binding transport protein (Tim44 family)